ncbi:MAG: ATP-binding protein, partial [Methanobacteriota archaeon]
MPMDRRIIEAYLAEFKERRLPELVERSLKVEITKDAIISIIGPRRTGKTYYLFQLISRFGKDESLYLNFEDPELYDITSRDIKEIVNIHKEVFGRRPRFLFFDEIQNIPEWDKAVRSLYELKDFHIFLTGSSSKLLSKEIATSLRGRTISYTLLPFSFKRFLDIQKIGVEGPVSFSKEATIKNMLRQYISHGGFPQVVLNPRKEYVERFLKEYLDLVMYRDVIERYKIKNLHVIRLMVNSLLASYSKEFSIHRFYRTLKSQNVVVSKKTLYNYFAYFEDALLIFPLRKHSHSRKSSYASMPKIYLVDASLALGRDSDERGRKIENLVALELIRRRSYLEPLTEICYYKSPSGREVDFVITDRSGVRQLIQVCHDIEDVRTKERELEGLITASRKLECRDLLVITWDYEALEDYK